MSELEKAKQIAAEAFNFKSKAYTTIEQQNEIIEVNRKAFMQIISLPSLTIPKSVAVLLDERWKAQNRYLQRKVTVPRDALYNAVNPYDNELADTSIGEWIDKNQNICFAYLSSKALGVDLVKVMEG